MDLCFYVIFVFINGFNAPLCSARLHDFYAYHIQINVAADADINIKSSAGSFK